MQKIEPVKRKSVKPVFSMCVQPLFLIGTNNEDGSCNFAPITWVSVTNEQGDDYLIVISMFGTKRTKQNVRRTGMLSVNLVSRDLLPLADYFGTHHAQEGKMKDLPCPVSRGEVLDVPVLDASRWVYECEVQTSVETGDSETFFCRIRNVQIDERIECKNAFDVDLTKFDPVIYSGKYHSIGRLLGEIGDFLPKEGLLKNDEAVKTVNIYGKNYSGVTNHERIASRGIVLHEGKILLSYLQKPDVWMIPGGGIEGSETPEECCVRELSEETGVLAAPGKRFLLINEYYEDWKYASYYFLCEAIGKTEPHLTELERSFEETPRWISLEEAIGLFSKHADYAETDEEKRGIYLREYTALLALTGEPQ